MSCTRCHAPLEASDLRCPICALPTPAPEQTQAAASRVLRCEECSAAIAYSAEKQNAVCGFCGAVMKVEEPVDPIETPEARVLMSVSAESAKAAVKQWLSNRGFFRPSDLSSASTIDTVHALWWAGWVCDADATVSWAADSNHNSHRSAWAPHSGKTKMEFKNVLVSASRGLSLTETDALKAHYDLRQLEAVTAGKAELEQAELEQFDVQRSAARKIVAHGIEREAVERLPKGVIPGSRYRNVHANVLLAGLTTRRLGLPAWVLVYRFKDKLYRAVVHGQRADVVVGTSPISWAKVVTVTLLVVGTLAALAAMLWWR